MESFGVLTILFSSKLFSCISVLSSSSGFATVVSWIMYFHIFFKKVLRCSFYLSCLGSTRIQSQSRHCRWCCVDMKGKDRKLGGGSWNLQMRFKEGMKHDECQAKQMMIPAPLWIQWRTRLEFQEGRGGSETEWFFSMWSRANSALVLFCF